MTIYLSEKTEATLSEIPGLLKALITATNDIHHRRQRPIVEYTVALAVRDSLELQILNKVRDVAEGAYRDGI